MVQPSCLSILSISLVAVIGLSGCVSADVRKAKVETVREVPMGRETRPIAFRKIILKIPRGKAIGAVGVGLLCVERAKIQARTGRYRLNDEVFNDVFRNELINNNYTVVGDPDALFDDSSLDRAQYFIAGLIKDIQANTCYPNAGWGDVTRGTASAYLKVEWQLYETLSRKVVYKTTTEGSAEQSESVTDPMDYVLGDAFGMATQNLLADKGFHDLVAGRAELATAAATGEDAPLRLRAMRRKLSKRFDAVELRPGVVIIRSPNSHGSGFFATNDGFIITNQHVVGGAKNVRIVLHSGREVPGEVLRASRVPDVALIKVGGSGYVALPIRFDELSIGDDVLVYGAPLTERMEGSLTRGIISAYRNRKRMGKLIQSDVVIQGGNSGGPMMDKHGNVIAVTVAGLEKGGAATGQNFFIPIREAFDALNLVSSTSAAGS